MDETEKLFYAWRFGPESESETFQREVDQQLQYWWADCNKFGEVGKPL